MKHIIFSVFLFSILTSCGQNSKIVYKYKCAKQLTENEIKNYQINTFENYSDSDLDLLADITTFIIDSNPEKDSYECFFNKREKKLLVLDVFGLENEDKIDKTLCNLVENKQIKLPKKTIILFHKYENEFDDGGIIVGLRIDN